jgi:hypothetical protein
MISFCSGNGGSPSLRVPVPICRDRDTKSCRNNLLTNALSEGINRVIKSVKNRAHGFAGVDAFTDMIFLTVGDGYPCANS